MAKLVNRKKVLRQQQRAVKRHQQMPSSPEQLPELTVYVQKITSSLEDFQALPELSGLPVDRLASLYEAGIRSLADFAQWTEQDLLALKGIGPATIKKLLDNGVVLAD